MTFYTGSGDRELPAPGSATRAEDLDFHTFRLHALKGDRRSFWAITVRANRRITFRVDDGDAFDVDPVDYH